MYSKRIIKEYKPYAQSPITNGNAYMAEFIHKNFNLMDESELKNVVTKCMTYDDVCHVLLKFEFENYNPERKNMGVVEFKKLIRESINKFQGIVGGTHLRCRKWNELITDKDIQLWNSIFSSYYEYDETIYLWNTVYAPLYENEETEYFLKTLKNYVNRFAENLQVCYFTVHNKRDDLRIISLKIVDKKAFAT